jgi:hypothetical protein
MKTSVTLATAALLASIGLAHAGDTPGQQMQSDSAPGASEYAPKGESDVAPGKQMQEDTGPGASNYAPGQDDDLNTAPGKSADAPGQNKSDGSDPSIE